MPSVQTVPSTSAAATAAASGRFETSRRRRCTAYSSGSARTAPVPYNNTRKGRTNRTQPAAAARSSLWAPSSIANEASSRRWTTPSLVRLLGGGITVSMGRPLARPRAAGVAVPPTGEDWAYGERSDGNLLLGDRPDAKPKQPLNNTITPFVLRCVELVHWAFFMPVFYLAYMLAASQLAAAAAGTLVLSPLQAFCMASFPLVQGLAALAPMALHEYEGWQIADFKEPTSTTPPPVDRTFLALFNNQWMRQVILRFLLQFQAAGLMMFNYAVLPPAINTYYAPLCALSILFFVFGGKRAWHITPFWAPPKSPPVPLPPLLWVMGPFILHAVVSLYTLAVRVGAAAAIDPAAAPLQLLLAALPSVASATGGLLLCAGVIFAFFRNGSYVYPHGLIQGLVLAAFGFAWPLALGVLSWVLGSATAVAPKVLVFWAPLALVQVGGIMEAFFAEISHDHWLHVVAVWHMICGFISMKLWLLGA